MNDKIISYEVMSLPEMIVLYHEGQTDSESSSIDIGAAVVIDLSARKRLILDSATNQAVTITDISSTGNTPLDSLLTLITGRQSERLGKSVTLKWLISTASKYYHKVRESGRDVFLPSLVQRGLCTTKEVQEKGLLGFGKSRTVTYYVTNPPFRPQLENQLRNALAFGGSLDERTIFLLKIFSTLASNKREDWQKIDRLCKNSAMMQAVLREHYGLQSSLTEGAGGAVAF